MSFGTNLRTARSRRNISQEELAEMLNVSRQAVSKWELDQGYPETEKLAALSEALNVSIDYLLGGMGFAGDGNAAGGENTVAGEEEPPAGEGRPAGAGAEKGKAGAITIKSERGIVNCTKVQSRLIPKARADEPKAALFGVDGTSFWGENSTFLGWYKCEADLLKEMDGIWAAMAAGEAVYALQYAAKVNESFLRVKLAE